MDSAQVLLSHAKSFANIALFAALYGAFISSMRIIVDGNKPSTGFSVVSRIIFVVYCGAFCLAIFYWSAWNSSLPAIAR